MTKWTETEIQSAIDGIEQSVRYGKAHGGSECCGARGTLHRWFCFGTSLMGKREPPPWMIDEAPKR